MKALISGNSRLIFFLIEINRQGCNFYSNLSMKNRNEKSTVETRFIILRQKISIMQTTKLTPFSENVYDKYRYKLTNVCRCQSGYFYSLLLWS